MKNHRIRISTDILNFEQCSGYELIKCGSSFTNPYPKTHKPKIKTLTTIPNLKIFFFMENYFLYLRLLSTYQELPDSKEKDWTQQIEKNLISFRCHLDSGSKPTGLPLRNPKNLFCFSATLAPAQEGPPAYLFETLKTNFVLAPSWL